MSFECAATFDGIRCPNDDAGDTVYLGALTFCVSHQEAFEELAQSKKLLLEIASARMCRTDWGKAMAEAARNPTVRTGPTERRDMRAEATVYFIRCEGFVKIGYAIAPHKRLKQLQATDGTKYPDGMNCSTAALIQTEPGGINRERDLHQQFKHLRHTGEWFTEAKELTDYIEGLAA